MLDWRILKRRSSNIISPSQISSDNRHSGNDQREFESYNYCKSTCTGCFSKCLFKLSEINSKNEHLTQAQIILELHAHGHPESRLNRVNRSTGH